MSTTVLWIERYFFYEKRVGNHTYMDEWQMLIVYVQSSPFEMKCHKFI